MCKDGAPELQQAFQAYKDKGVIFLGSFYMSKRAEIRAFRDEFHLTFPVGKAKSMARELRVETIPEIVFLSRDGKISTRIKGKVTFEALTAAIEEILADR